MAGTQTEDMHRLVQRAADRSIDERDRLAAFEALVRHYQQMVYACAYAKLGDFHQAEDIAQESFLAAYRRLGDLREPRAFAGWLRRIVVSRCISSIRKKKLPTTSLDRIAEPPCPQREPTGIASGDGPSQTSAVAALRTLPEDHRLAMALYYVDGYPQEEIAEFLDIPTSTLRGRLFRCRARMKKELLVGVSDMMRSVPLPEDFADVVVRGATGSADLAAARRMMDYIAQIKPEHFATPGSAEKAGIFFVGDPGNPTTAGYFNEVRLSVGSVVLTACRAPEMAFESFGAPHPTFREGYKAFYKIAHQRDIALSVVHGSHYDHPFVGFVPSFYYPLATLPCEVAEKAQTTATLRPAGEAETADAQRAFVMDPWAPKLHPPMSRGEVHVVEQDRQTAGYARSDARLTRIDADQMSRRRLDYTLVSDITVSSREAALAVLKLAADRARHSGRDTLCLMHSHQTLITRTLLELGGCYSIRNGCPLANLGERMACILDLGLLVEQLAAEMERRFAASPAAEGEADLSIEMDGQVVGFRTRDGRLEIVHHELPIHRRLPRWVVTRLVLGYWSGRDVLEMGPLAWDRSDGIVADDIDMDQTPLTLPEEEALLLESLFPKLWPTAWPDPDVWAWLIGEPVPDYYFPRKGRTLDPKTRATISRLRWPWLGR